MPAQEQIKGLRFLRKGEWYRNAGVHIDQEVVEETVKSLRPNRCPVCKGDLERKDNFGTTLPLDGRAIEGYCPKDDYIVRLEAYQYLGNTSGTELHMEIFTNSRHSRLVADSGRLADFESHYVELHMFG